MFNSLNSLLRASMEAAAPAALANTVPETDLIAESDQAHLNLCDAKEDLAISENDMQRLVEAVDSLEAIAQSMEAYTTTGMTQSTAFIAQLAIDQAVAPTGVCYKGISLEGFAGHRAGHSTRLAMEDLQSTARAVVAKLIEAFKQFRAAVAQFFKQLSHMTGIYRVRAEKLYEATKTPTAEEWSNTVKEWHEDKQIVTRLSINGQIPSNLAHLADDNLKLTTEFFNHGREGYAGQVLDHADRLSELGVELVKYPKAYDHNVATAAGIKCPVPPRVGNAEGEWSVEKQRTSDLLPGNYRIGFHEATLSDHLNSLLGTYPTFFKDHEAKADVPDALKPSNRGEACGIAAANFKVFGLVEGFFREHSAHEEKHNRLVESALQSIVHLEDGGDSQNQKAAIAALRSATSVDMSIHRAMMGVCNHVSDVARALQLHAEKSAKAAA